MQTRESTSSHDAREETPKPPGPGDWRMPSREDFAHDVEASLGGVLRELEKDRRRMIARSLLAVPVVVPLAIAGFFIGTALQANRELLPYAVGVLAVLGMIGWSYLFTRSYRKAFKQRLVSPLVKSFGMDFRYTDDGFVSPDSVKASGIFSQPFDRYSGQDHITGTAGKTRFECSVIRAERETNTSDGSGSQRKKWKTIFAGLFLVADFDADFSGSTWVFSGKGEWQLGWIGNKLREWTMGSRGELVTLEDSEFARLFAVYASDPEQARHLLSPSLMRRITDYRRKLKHPLWMAFRNGVLYVAIVPGRTLFEPRLLSAVDRRQCMSIFDDIALALGLIEALNLSTRIGSGP